MSEKFISESYLKEKREINIYQERSKLLNDFSKATLRDRYLLRDEGFQERFATVACCYSESNEHAQRMYDYMSNLWMMGSTPVTGNGGTTKGLPISCFLNKVDDKLESIIDNFHENSWLGALGGGTGTDWSPVREIGAPIGQVGKSSGIIPFIKVADSGTIAISQGSLRRGSNAAYLHISHPEINEFIKIRKTTGGDTNRKAQYIHHGIVIPDEFMIAVRDGLEWNLVSPQTKDIVSTVSARDLWAEILELRISTGEPYLIFEDNVNNTSPETYKALGLKVSQSNLCTEIMETTGRDHLDNVRTAVCCLASMNLEYLDEWFGNTIFIKDCMLFLDNVLSDFILQAKDKPGFKNAVYSAERERSIGLGIMGFHSYLQMNNIPFESAMAVSKVRKIFSWIDETTTRFNKEIAEEKGSCPDAIDVGLTKRFTHTTTIPPTASISILANNCSPGVEPYISNAYTQKTLSGSFGVKNKHLNKLLVQRYSEVTTELNLEEWLSGIWSSITVNEGSVQHIDVLTDYEKMVYKTAYEIDNEWIIELASHYTPHITQGASINIFLDPKIQKTKLHKVHYMAWKKGLKSLYYLRSRSLRRAGNMSNMAGTMPTEEHSQGDPKINDIDDYEECLACQ